MLSTNYDRAVVYGIPHPKFFTQSKGIGGHVSHAIGGTHGLTSVGFDVIGLASLPSIEFTKECVEVHEGPPIGYSRVVWQTRFTGQLARLVRTYHPKFVYIRYAGSFGPFLPLLGNCIAPVAIVLEVNSLVSQVHKILSPVDALALRSATVITTVSQLQRDLIIRCAGRGIEDRVVVVPNGVQEARFRSETKRHKAFRSSKDPITIGYIGIFKKDYGLESLISAYENIVKRNRKVRLVMCGTGPHFSYIEKRARAISGLELRGAVPYSQVPEIMQSFDIAIYPASNTHLYQSPIKLYEYMAAGCAIIAASTPSTKDALEDGELGLLHEIGDGEQLSQLIEKLLINEDLRKNLAARAQMAALTKHTWTQRYEYLKMELIRQGIHC